MEELQNILKTLKNLTTSELQIVQSHLFKVIYAKGVEDHIRALQMEPLFSDKPKSE